jgi:hypothetical protein
MSDDKIIKIWEKVVKIVTRFENNRVVDQKKIVVSNGPASDLVNNNGVIDKDMEERLNNWIKHRTQRFILSGLDKIMPFNRSNQMDGMIYTDSNGKKFWCVSLEQKKDIRDKILDATNDLWRDFKFMLELMIKNPMIIRLNQSQVDEIQEATENDSISKDNCS